MKRIIFLIIISVIFSCGKEKIIQLPEINHSDITEINDVSVAYLFYDETTKDSVILNRSNLISTTNWLVNVDKRLTLKQAIPHIKYLQEKKSSATHKIESAKNYFTCYDTKKKNLGFIEFTDVVYHEESFDGYISKISGLDFSKKMKIEIDNSEEIDLSFPIYDLGYMISNKSNLKNDIISTLAKEADTIEIYLGFNKNVTFQKYISIKSILLNSKIENLKISNNEFISN